MALSTFIQWHPVTNSFQRKRDMIPCLAWVASLFHIGLSYIPSTFILCLPPSSPHCSFLHSPYIFLCLSVYLSVCLFLCLSACLSVCLSISLPSDLTTLFSYHPITSLNIWQLIRTLFALLSGCAPLPITHDDQLDITLRPATSSGLDTRGQWPASRSLVIRWMAPDKRNVTRHLELENSTEVVGGSTFTANASAALDL